MFKIALIRISLSFSLKLNCLLRLENRDHPKLITYKNCFLRVGTVIIYLLELFSDGKVQLRAV